MGGGSRCAGRVELFQSWGDWQRVRGWNLKAAAVLCRHLDCGSAVSTRPSIGDEDRPVSTYEFTCNGSESSPMECGKEKRWSTAGAAQDVICSGNKPIILLYS